MQSNGSKSTRTSRDPNASLTTSVGNEKEIVARQGVIMKVRTSMCVSETQHILILKVSRVLARAVCCLTWLSVQTLKVVN